MLPPALNPGDGRSARLLRHAVAGPLRFTLKHYSPMFEQGEHEHPHAVIDLVVGGHGRGRYGVAERVSQPGAVEFFGARVGHTFRSGAVGIRTLHMSFDPSLAPPACADVHAPRAFGLLCQVLERLVDNAGGDSDLESLGLELVGCLRQAEPVPRGRPRWLTKMHETFSEDPSPPGVCEFARSLGVDPSHAVRAFRAAFGQSPGEVARAARVARACSGIAGGQPPSRAAADAGFADQAHLTRALRTAASITPARVRRIMARARAL